jgi:AcrR family transcriptional regulator
MPHVSAAERRPQLIRAAIDVMLREGVAGASTRAIAAELGIAQAMVHYCFGTKDELHRAVIEQVTADVTAQIVAREPVPEDADFREAVRAIAQGFWRVVVDDPGAFALLSDLVNFGLRSPTLRPMVAEYQQQLDAAMADRIRHAIEVTGVHRPARPPEDVAHFFFAGIDGLLVHRLVRQADEPGYVRCLDDLVEATAALATGRHAAAAGRRGARLPARATAP